MNIRLVYVTVTLFSLVVASCARQPAPQAQEDAAALEKKESEKRFADIGKVQDEIKRRELLEKYIREYPKASNIDRAYSSLLAVLYKADVARAITLADEILARPRDPKSSVWKNAYTYKFLALQKQISELGNKILEAERDPGVLRNAAGFDRDHSSKLFEKAIAERQKNSNKGSDPDPFLDELHLAFSRKLSELGEKDEALKEASLGIEIARARVTEMEALPKEDPERRRLVGLKEGLAYSYKDLASLYFESGEPQEGLEALVQAEKLAGASSRALRPSLEETRAKIQAGMGKTEEALESYTRAFSFRMSPAIRDKIRTLASKKGKPADGYFSRARELRQASAEPFKAFALKTDDGKPARLESLKGKVTLVNFFFPT
jgi:hypothetical protein